MKWAYSMGSRFLLSSPFLLFPGSFKGRAACEGRAILSFLTMQETVQLGKDTFILQETWKAGMGGEHDDNGEIDVTGIEGTMYEAQPFVLVSFSGLARTK